MGNPQNLRFPQGPIVGPNGYITLEWQEWLQNPQFITVSLADVVGVESGGTGLSSGTSGGVLGFTAPGTIASSAELKDGILVTGGGAGSTPYTPTPATPSTAVYNALLPKEVVPCKNASGVTRYVILYG